MKFLYLLSMWIYLWFINNMLEIEPLILIIRNRLVLNDIELIAEGWVSRWVEPNQTAGRTGLRKSNQRKARYQHLKVMTHPTNQHAQHNWHFCFIAFFLLYFSELLVLIPWRLFLVTIAQPDSCNRWKWSESDTFQGTSQQLREVGSANKRNRGKMGNPPPQIWLRFASTRGGSQEDEKPPRPGGHN